MWVPAGLRGGRFGNLVRPVARTLRKCGLRTVMWQTRVRLVVAAIRLSRLRLPGDPVAAPAVLTWVVLVPTVVSACRHLHVLVSVIVVLPLSCTSTLRNSLLMAQWSFVRILMRVFLASALVGRVLQASLHRSCGSRANVASAPTAEVTGCRLLTPRLVNMLLEPLLMMTYVWAVKLGTLIFRVVDGAGEGAVGVLRVVIGLVRSRMSVAATRRACTVN